jgi:uncharacterized Zn finger protein (UPF0148 family)
MALSITCSCGYSGPAVSDGGTVMCPLCREPAAAREEEKRWRIPCPNGHVFGAPDSWMGRQMVCPTCNEPFVLAIADSLEKREERRRRLQKEEEEFARLWLKRAIWAAVAVVAFIASLIVFSLMK